MNNRQQYLKEKGCECWSNHNTGVVNKPGTETIKHVRPLEICHDVSYYCSSIYILLIALQKCKTILFKDQDVGDDEDVSYCVGSIAKTVANCPIGDSAQYHVHHIFHHDVHLLKTEVLGALWS